MFLLSVENDMGGGCKMNLFLKTTVAGIAFGLLVALFLITGCSIRIGYIRNHEHKTKEFCFPCINAERW